jgi:Holliday junction resolvase
MSEMDLVNAVIDTLRYRGAVALRINAGQVQVMDNGRPRIIRLAPAGTSDVIACLRGRFMAVECKIGNNKPTELQQAFLDSVTAAGGIAIAAWSIDDVLKLGEVEG